MAPVLTLEIGHTEVVAEHRVRGGVRWRATAPLGSTAELAAVVAGLAAVEGAPHGARLRVHLGDTLVQRRELPGLPPVRRGDLRTLVQHGSAKFFRTVGRPLVTDARWSGRDRKVAVAIAAEVQLVTALLAGAETAGYQVESIDAGTPEISLLPAELRLVRQRESRRWRLRAGVALGVFATGVAASMVIAALRESRELDRELVRLRPTVDAVLAVEAKRDRVLAGVAAVERPVAERMRPVLLLSAVVRALPDSTWLIRAAFDVAAGSLTGFAGRPIAVLNRMAREAALPPPRADGRSAAETIDGRQVERFGILFGPEGVR